MLAVNNDLSTNLLRRTKCTEKHIVNNPLEEQNASFLASTTVALIEQKNMSTNEVLVNKYSKTVNE